MQALARSAGWIRQLLGASAAVGGVQGLEGAGVPRRKPLGAMGAGGGGQHEATTAAAEAAMVRQQDLLLQAVGLRLLLATLEAR